MKAEIKQKWLESLRSDRFEQGIGELCTTYQSGRVEHCCLGVLAETMGVDRSKLIDNSNLDVIGHSDVLGPWGEGTFVGGDTGTHTTVQRRLAAMNDNETPFTEIADWIEANVPAE